LGHFIVNILGKRAGTFSAGIINVVIEAQSYNDAAKEYEIILVK
jgi:hypothetical protein